MSWLGMGVCCRRQVLDFLSHVTLCQRYQNTDDAPIECVYTFPMDAKAAVNRLLVTVGDRVIEGCVMETAAARETYDAAVSAGAGAYLVEQSKDSSDVFRASVGNLLPGEVVDVRISYVSEVSLEGEFPAFSGHVQWCRRSTVARCDWLALVVEVETVLVCVSWECRVDGCAMPRWVVVWGFSDCDV